MFNKSKLIIIICLLSGTAKSATGSIAQSATSSTERDSTMMVGTWVERPKDEKPRWADDLDGQTKKTKLKTVRSIISKEKFDEVLKKNPDFPTPIIEELSPFITLIPGSTGRPRIIYMSEHFIILKIGNSLVWFYKHEDQILESLERVPNSPASFSRIRPFGPGDTAENTWKGEPCTIVIEGKDIRYAHQIFSGYSAYMAPQSGGEQQDYLIQRVCVAFNRWGITRALTLPPTSRFSVIRVLPPESEAVIGLNLSNQTTEGEYAYRGSTTPVSITAERDTKGDITKVTIRIGETVFDSREDLPKWSEKKPNRCQGSNILREEEQVAEQDEGQSKGRK